MSKLWPVVDGYKDLKYFESLVYLKSSYWATVYGVAKETHTT